MLHPGACTWLVPSVPSGSQQPWWGHRDTVCGWDGAGPRGFEGPAEDVGGPAEARSAPQDGTRLLGRGRHRPSPRGARDAGRTESAEPPPAGLGGPPAWGAARNRGGLAHPRPPPPWFAPLPLPSAAWYGSGAARSARSRSGGAVPGRAGPGSGGAMSAAGGRDACWRCEYRARGGWRGRGGAVGKVSGTAPAQPRPGMLLGAGMLRATGGVLPEPHRDVPAPPPARGCAPPPGGLPWPLPQCLSLPRTRMSPGTGMSPCHHPQDRDILSYWDVPMPSPPGQGHPHQFGAGAPAQNQCPRGDGALLALVPLPQLIPSACHGTPQVQSHPLVCHSHAAPCKASGYWGTRDMPRGATGGMGRVGRH